MFFGVPSPALEQSLLIFAARMHMLFFAYKMRDSGTKHNQLESRADGSACMNIFLGILKGDVAQNPLHCHAGPGAVATPIWDKAEAQDASMYDSSPYKEPMAAFAKLMLEDGRSGHSVEHIARCLPNFSRCCAPLTLQGYHMIT